MSFEESGDLNNEQVPERHERSDREKLNSGNMGEITEVFNDRINNFQESDLAPDANGRTYDRFEQKVWSVFPERDGSITDLKAGASKHLCGVSD